MEDLTLIDYLYISGSVASILGALWSMLQAKKASKSADKALSLKNEMIDRKELVEISKIHSRTERILTEVSKIGPSCNIETLKGIDPQGIAKQVEEYVRNLREHISFFFY